MTQDFNTPYCPNADAGIFLKISIVRLQNLIGQGATEIGHWRVFAGPLLGYYWAGSTLNAVRAQQRHYKGPAKGLF
jgi:hypothetical protein